MNIFLNIVWLVFGGLLLSIGYLISSLLLMITVIGIPFGFQTLKLCRLSLMPFGTDVIYSGTSPGCLNTFMNIWWLLFGGFLISLSWFLLGAIFCITVIGVPFGLQCFKLAKITLHPFGLTIVNR